MASPLSPHHHFFKYRLALLISMGMIVPLGYAVRFYQGGQGWLNDAFGSIAYEICLDSAGRFPLSSGFIAWDCRRSVYCNLRVRVSPTLATPVFAGN